MNCNWQFAVTNNRLTFVSFHIVFLSFCRSWENVTPAPGSGIQNSDPAHSTNALVPSCVGHVCRPHQSIPVLACTLCYVICSVVDQGGGRI